MNEAKKEHCDILLVEDDPSLALGLSDTLRFEGWSVEHTPSGAKATELARSLRPRCIVLDLMLPDRNGYQVCEDLRRVDPYVSILMLTARGQEADKIRGLNSGADDYVTKPFSVAELVARIRALMRRVESSGGARNEASFRIGECLVHPKSHTLECQGKRSELSFYEVEVLRLLFERSGQPVTRDEILDRVWGVQANSTNRTVDNVIVKLRKKIEAQPERPRFILTVYGVGYKLSA